MNTRRVQIPPLFSLHIHTSATYQAQRVVVRPLAINKVIVIITYIYYNKMVYKNGAAIDAWITPCTVLECLHFAFIGPCVKIFTSAKFVKAIMFMSCLDPCST